MLTQRNDNFRTGQNTAETILTPSNVNTTTFGKLFSVPVDGYVYAQPLYLANVSIPGNGVHNVLFVATEHDSVYAFDADSHSGTTAAPLWQASLLDTAHGAVAGATTEPASDVSTYDISPEIGITATPVIDPNTGTMYLVGETVENGNPVQRLHALDVATGAEKFGGPVVIQASVAGTGNGSSGGVLSFDPKWQNSRAGLLLQNGIIYIAFGSHGDNGPWHGWILGYQASNLQQTGAYCTTPTGIGGGIWMSGTGLAGDIVDPGNHPFGRLFASTGNGWYTANVPYTADMDFSDDELGLDLTNGVPRITDSFTPYNQQQMDQGDWDVGSGGILVLPDQSSGPNRHLLVQVGKWGTIYLVNRDNMGGYNTSGDNIVQEITGQVHGVWGAPAYWNNTIYMGPTNDQLKAFSLNNGLLSSTPVSASQETYQYPGPTPAISANGNTNGIVWVVKTETYSTSGPAVLTAYDATNLANTLYSTDQNAARDNPGNPVKFSVATIANGKVYVSAQYQVSVYGLLNSQQPGTPPPPPSNTGSSTNVDFTQGFSSSTQLMTFNGSTDLDDTRLQLTNGGSFEAGSAFYNTPVNIKSFTSDFTFQLSTAVADGMTFTLQGNGPSALGASGGGLGYSGIPNSVAIKFDLYSNAGEGNDSTGLFSGGAMPTVPAIDLSSYGIDLHSGDTMAVHLLYDGSTLSMRITDGVTNASYSTNWSVNIPSLVGGSTAYVGFTGGTGGASASQKIESWTFTSTSTGSAAGALVFYPVAPCRVVDTRSGAGSLGGPMLSAGSSRSFPVPSSACGIPADAAAYSLNVTVVPSESLQYLTLWPTGQAQPYVSTLNSFDGRVVANAAIVPAGSNGAVSAYATGATDLVLDVNGYFAPPNGQGNGSNPSVFVSAVPCRALDTRNANGILGGPGLGANSSRDFPVPSSSCGVPQNVSAYSANVTAIPNGSLPYLTLWPTGQTQPYVSTLNAYEGEVVANAAIVPAGSNGSLSTYAAGPTDLALDLNGYFVPYANSGTTSGMFVPVTPCRVVDTRSGAGTFGGPTLAAGTTRSFPISAGACGIPANAQAYVLNVTAVPAGSSLQYLTLWPTGQAQPNVSTLNSTDGRVVANEAIVPAGANGAISVYVTDTSDVIFDISGYIAP